MLSCIVFVWLACPSQAVPTIEVGSHDLQENTSGQTVNLLVSGGDSVTSFNLRAQLGDGTGANPEPVFEAISFGGVWDAHANTVTGGPIDGAEQFAQASVAFNTSVDVPADGLLVSLTIDTTDFFAGESFALQLKSTEIGSDSDFVILGGDTLAPQITNGTINIVPEPASIALLGLGGLALLRRRWA
jgi:hypothetical protein